MTQPISMLELEEYLFAQTEASQHRTKEERIQQIRDLLWTHRFFIFTWLMMNGVCIPIELVSDTLHQRPGNQSVDKPIT